MTHSVASRRQFLKTSAAAAAGLAVAPAFVPSTAFGANERIVTGHIGLGGQGRGNLGKFIKNAVAICDVDSKHAEQAAKTVKDKAGTECEIYGDYRKILDRKDIDAVVISTPDHWHALPTIEACQAGKDVYCEKPLTLTVVEGRKIVEAARANKRIVQTGSQQRSASNFRKACELVRSGYLGKLQTVLVGIPGPNHPGKPIPDSDPPAELDYDFWLGQAPLRPYNKNRVHYNFRFFWDYSGGQMTNWGAHHIDIAHWGMGMDDSGPISVDGKATFHPEHWHDVTETCRITYVYPNDVTMILGQKEKDIPQGTTFIGEKGQIFVNRGQFKATPGEIGEIKLTDSDVHLYDSSDHHKNFLDCIKSRELPICDAEIGHRTATACHLGNISCRLGRKIAWDAKSETISGDDEAAGMLSRPYRAPWELT
ncbi:Gfo/Idh/MocA family oxidoreductase [Blastopirellula sp. JC732]|uniref:Gfo/Idh/MocA family oxidoreductase n=1 Tax=Blastopirellula sediminis TaxID=2894196 RepID=A0A9X1MIY3_9BACT|nr:Gfo/Idh/MocA family oxidoreductase [Blastopirellula sediminis]MCC9607786.1 Gfo/Idh/MocA family oxidoreductase [Blastopirellula sediminis]MCC9627421.1 Gfo/Idh/MocA family oxidoreductase [Blastopirellula sediminis]